MEYKKLLIKVFVSKNGKGSPSWEHFCYVPKEVHRSFLSATKSNTCDLITYLEKWARKDFGYTKTLSQYVHVVELRKYIAEQHENILKEHIDENTLKYTNTSGLTNSWTTKHMLEEIAKCQQNI